MSLYDSFPSEAKVLVQSCILASLSTICERTKLVMRDVVIEIVVNKRLDLSEEVSKSFTLDSEGEAPALSNSVPLYLSRFWVSDVQSHEFLVDAMADMFRDLPTQAPSSDDGVNPDDEPPPKPKPLKATQEVVIPPLRPFKEMMLHLEHHRRGMICDGTLMLACQLVPVQVDIVRKYMSLPASVKEKCTLAEWDFEVEEAVRLGSI